MPECDDHEHGSQRQQSRADAPADEEEDARGQLDEGNGEADCPQRPEGQEGVLIRQEPFANVARGSHDKDFVHARHEENESENESREEERPCPRPRIRKIHEWESSVSHKNRDRGTGCRSQAAAARAGTISESAAAKLAISSGFPIEIRSQFGIEGNFRPT
jgi:hypothetical protein